MYFINLELKLVYNHPDLVPAAPVAVRHRKPRKIAAAGLITSKICSVALSFLWTEHACRNVTITILQVYTCYR